MSEPEDHQSVDCIPEATGVESDANKQPNYNLWHTNTTKRQKELASLNVPLANASSVCVGETVYVGGGNDISCAFIYGYNAHENNWELLPKVNDLSAFALCEVNNQLVAVGGWNARTGKPTNSVLTYMPDDPDHWSPLDSFTTPRACPAVASNCNYITVYGGLSNGKDKTSLIHSLEIYSIQLKKWFTYEDLPFKNEGSFVSSVLTANNKLLLASGKTVSWTSLDQLMKNEEDTQTSAMVVPGNQLPRSMVAMKSQSVPAYLSENPCEEKPGARSTSMSYCQETQEGSQIALPQILSYPWRNVQLLPNSDIEEGAISIKCAPCVSFTLFGEQIIALWDDKLYMLNISTDSWGLADRLSSGLHLTGSSVVDLKTQAKLFLIGGTCIKDSCLEKSDKVFQISYLV